MRHARERRQALPRRGSLRARCAGGRAAGLACTMHVASVVLGSELNMAMHMVAQQPRCFATAAGGGGAAAAA